MLLDPATPPKLRVSPQQVLATEFLASIQPSSPKLYARLHFIMIFNIELVSLYLCVALAANSSVLAAPTPMHPGGWSGSDDIRSAPALARQLDDSSTVPDICLVEPPTQLCAPRRRQTLPSMLSLQDEGAKSSSSSSDDGAQTLEQQIQQIMMQTMHPGSASLAPATASQRRQDSSSLYPFLTNGRFGGSADASPLAMPRFDAGDLQFGQTADFGRRWSWPSDETPDLGTIRWDVGALSPLRFHIY